MEGMTNHLANAPVKRFQMYSNNKVSLQADIKLFLRKNNIYMCWICSAWVQVAILHHCFGKKFKNNSCTKNLLIIFTFVYQSTRAQTKASMWFCVIKTNFSSDEKNKASNNWSYLFLCMRLQLHIWSNGSASSDHVLS